MHIPSSDVESDLYVQQSLIAIGIKLYRTHKICKSEIILYWCCHFVYRILKIFLVLGVLTLYIVNLTFLIRIVLKMHCFQKFSFDRSSPK